MADILADYREWRDQQAARVSTHSDGCHMWHRDCMIQRLADALGEEQARRTLTDEERAAIQWFAHYGLPERYAAALRELLERMKP
jgi:hypothetical protein